VDTFQSDETDNFWIIGFGNRHRRDDGIGPVVVERLKRRLGDLHRVNLVSLHQLGPELAEDLSTATGVIFIDAALGPLPGGFSWGELRPVGGMHQIVHSLTATALLRLTQLLYNRCPSAWMVSVEGNDFEFGEGLSPAASDRATRATGEIVRFIFQPFSYRVFPA
jgi:hydrogenase maturation protease